ncbi:MAG: hypothetical protein ACD_50C00026G0004 [uncultured bacterium]|nr:MAG: hypothetical protein ACD_50C00026G0004 [uncultured bacterium]OGH13060.1 MAG: ATP synthase F0 subunit B [Candidatus Levybacteria bacterium RIFCSPHIGHO2_01_FULL_38_26]
MEFISNFGLDPILLVAQIVNFLVVLFILRKFLYKPILKTLEKRKNLIKDGLDKAQEATIRLEKIEEKERRVLSTAQKQAQQMLDEAKKESVGILKDAEDSTKAKVDKMLSDARMQISMESKDVEKKLTLYVSQLAVDFLKKTTEDLFNKEDQELVMKKAIKKLGQKN